MRGRLNEIREVAPGQVYSKAVQSIWGSEGGGTEPFEGAEDLWVLEGSEAKEQRYLRQDCIRV